MSLLVNILLFLSALLGIGLFANAYFRGQKVLKKLSQKKTHQSFANCIAACDIFLPELAELVNGNGKYSAAIAIDNS